MALYNAFDKNLHLSELGTPLPTAAGVLSATQRRQAVLNNIIGGTGLSIPESISMASGKFLLSSDAGTVTTSSTTTAVEAGDGIWHITKLTMTNFSLGNVGDNASLGIGAKFYTLPAGVLMIENASLTGTFDADVDATNSTPEIGIGTVIASGAVSVLGGTATFENVIEGATIADVDAEAYSVVDNPNGSTNSPLLITAAGSHDLFLNAAAAWANVTTAAPLLFTGVITVKWRKIS